MSKGTIVGVIVHDVAEPVEARALRTIVITLSLTAASARNIGDARRSKAYRTARSKPRAPQNVREILPSDDAWIDAGAALLLASLTQADDDIPPLRLRIIVPQNLYGMHASYEALDEIGERSWVTLPRDGAVGAVDFAGVTVDEATVFALALRRLGAFAYNNAGDGTPIIKYDLGMV